MARVLHPALAAAPGRRRQSDVRRRAYALVALFVALATVLTAAQPASERPVFAVGDIHGAYDAFTGVLRLAGLLDEAGTWSGGRAVLVQTGDYTDRGPKVREVLDLLMRLEDEAPRAGGQAVALLGNHEAMQVLGDRRDVSHAIYASFADAESDKRREEAWKAQDRLSSRRRRDMADANLAAPQVWAAQTRDAWMAAHPAGEIEYAEAMSPRGRYGRWIRQRPVAVKVDDTAFVHGGIGPAVKGSIDDVSKRARDEMASFDRVLKQLVSDGFALPFYTLEQVLDVARAANALSAAENARSSQGFGPGVPPYAVLNDIASWSLLDPDGPLWFRGYGAWSESEGSRQLAPILARFGVGRIVVGHTVVSSFRVYPRFDNQAFLIDTGMLAAVYNGRASALEIRGRDVAVVYGDTGRAPILTGSSR